MQDAEPRWSSAIRRSATPPGLTFQRIGPAHGSHRTPGTSRPQSVATPRGAYAGTTDRSKPDDVAPSWVSVAGAATRRLPRRYQSVGTGIAKAPAASVAVRASGVQPSGVRSSRSTGRPGVPDATPDTENPAPSATSPTPGVTWVRVVGLR